MVTLALAGASTGFGHTLLLTFLHHHAHHKHHIIVLSRTPNSELTAMGIEVRPVDYTNHAQLVTALQGVHTVLSLIGGSEEAVRTSQLALIPAMQEAGVKRFAPSEYAFPNYEGIEIYAGKTEVWKATKESGLEYTRFSCGLFMSVFATGTPKPLTEVGKRESRQTGEEEALVGLRPWNFVVNMHAGTADFPADGTTPLCWTDMRDVAVFVLHALDLEHWPEELGMRGGVMSFAHAVEVCERVQKRKWLTRTNGVEEMEKQAREDAGKRFYNEVRIAFARGQGMVGDELNKAFPHVQPVGCEEFIEKWWSGVELGAPSWSEDQSFM